MDSGTVFLPPIPFSYRRHGDTTIQRAYANSLAFQVSGMSIDPKGEIRDIKGPMNGPWKFEDIWPYLLGVVVLIGLGVGGVSYYRYWKRRRVRSVVSDIPAIPPHKEALSALRALEEQKLWQAGKIKPYYSEVTEIIRLFFEKRWHVIALELTTEEILGQLRRFPEAEAVWTEMGIFFRTADLVKFAKHIPSPEECTNEMRLAYDIVRAMIPHETPETVPMKEETADVR
jgi:hypothetical protein